MDAYVGVVHKGLVCDEISTNLLKASIAKRLERSHCRMGANETATGAQLLRVDFAAFLGRFRVSVRRDRACDDFPPQTDHPLPARLEGTRYGAPLDVVDVRCMFRHHRRTSRVRRGAADRV